MERVCVQRRSSLLLHTSREVYPRPSRGFPTILHIYILENKLKPPKGCRRRRFSLSAPSPSPVCLSSPSLFKIPSPNRSLVRKNNHKNTTTHHLRPSFILSRPPPHTTRRPPPRSVVNKHHNTIIISHISALRSSPSSLMSSKSAWWSAWLTGRNALLRSCTIQYQRSLRFRTQ